MTPPTSVRRWPSLPKPVLLTLAVVFCALICAYSAVWMYDAQPANAQPVELGFNQSHSTFFDSASSSIPVFDVEPGSPAERAGLRAGDQIVELNYHAMRSYSLLARIWSRSKPGDPVDVTVRRPGEHELLTLHAVFRPAGFGSSAEGVARSSAREVLSFFPIFFILVGFAVLFLRLENPHAWLLAFLFACFVAVPSFNNRDALPPLMATFAAVYRTIFLGLIPAAFYIFFALFPEKSPLEKRVPWLKWIALLIGIVQSLPGLPGREGDVRLPLFVDKWIGSENSDHLRLALSYTLIFLGIVSLLWNCTSPETSAESRRKSRILLAGTLVGVIPWVVEHIIIDFSGYRALFWVDTTLALLVLLYPLSFAYAVVKHRVLEIPALLRHSARYVLVQRSYFLLLFCAAMLAIFVFTHVFAGLFAEHSQFGMGLSAAFGVALVWVSGPVVKRGTDRIDRAFFRSSYDARIILLDLAEKTRTVTERQELVLLLESHIKNALHPKSLACYLEAAEGNLAIETEIHSAQLSKGSLPHPLFPFRFGAQFLLRDAETIPVTTPLLEELARNGKAWDVPPSVSDQGASANRLAPECLVPIVGRNTKLIGLLVIGPRLSEEPYYSEDKRLLESVAAQAAIALENMRLAQEMANRLERDRRAEREMQIARDVQSRLFPQTTPPLSTLDYAGSCIQARQVGGDYYDFWDFGSTHLALVLADISGKGISGALLMANLQANLRSRSTAARDDMFNEARGGNWLPTLLKSVNQLFYENTPDDRFATLFFAVYDDVSRQLEYANCGHNPPLLLRAACTVERLEPTASVIGLSPHWECCTQTVTLQPGDVLVIYTDGVTEANDAQGNEFGEGRLLQVVREHRAASPAQLLAAIQSAVQEFSVGEQFDDLTLVVARAR